MKQLWAVHVPTTIDRARMEPGLTNHLQVSDLVTILMQIGDQAQAYVALDGCNGCRSGRCEAGCRTDLLQRVMAARSDTTPLRLVVHGLRERAYTRRVLAWPGPSAQPLDGTLLHAWEDARLLVHFHPWPVKKGQIAAVALLVVGDGGAGPTERLHAWGWRGVRLPPWLPRSSTERLGKPPALPLGLPYRHAPQLVLPVGRVRSEPAPAQIASSVHTLQATEPLAVPLPPPGSAQETILHRAEAGGALPSVWGATANDALDDPPAEGAAPSSSDPFAVALAQLQAALMVAEDNETIERGTDGAVVEDDASAELPTAAPVPTMDDDITRSHEDRATAGTTLMETSEPPTYRGAGAHGPAPQAKEQTP